MWRHYVYKHVRKDTGEVFYVGKGSMRENRPPSHERAYALCGRSKFWRSVVRKHGYSVIIFASCKTDKAAKDLEKDLISKMGRRNKGGGLLVNLTDGGEGTCGMVYSQELRKIRSQHAKGPRSDKWIASIRKARKNGGNGGVVKKGDKLPDSWRKNISKAVRGVNNNMYGKRGKDTPNAREVINRSTGEKYESVSEAAEACGYKMKTLYNWLSGHRKNPTDLRFA